MLAQSSDRSPMECHERLSTGWPGPPVPADSWQAGLDLGGDLHGGERRRPTGPRGPDAALPLPIHEGGAAGPHGGRCVRRDHVARAGGDRCGALRLLTPHQAGHGPPRVVRRPARRATTARPAHAGPPGGIAGGAARRTPDSTTSTRSCMRSTRSAPTWPGRFRRAPREPSGPPPKGLTTAPSDTFRNVLGHRIIRSHAAARKGRSRCQAPGPLSLRIGVPVDVAVAAPQGRPRRLLSGGVLGFPRGQSAREPVRRMTGLPARLPPSGAW